VTKAATPPRARWRTERRRLGDLLRNLGERILVVVGVANGAEARLLHAALAELERKSAFPDFIGGFVTFVSGFLCAADRGLPDLGYVLRDEMARTVDTVEQATWLAALETETAAWPIGADIDTGYGNEPTAVLLACRQMHKQGASYVQIEDQYGLNKTCGHIDGARGKGKCVVSLEEMLDTRLRPALAYAREQEEFFVMARTDAGGPLGIDEALQRARAFAAEGAPMIFVEAPQSEAELLRVAAELADVPALKAANVVEGSAKTPAHGVRELHAMGFQIGLFPVGARLLAAAGLTAYYDALARGDQLSAAVSDDAATRFERYTRVLGRDQMQAWNRLWGEG
jgi:2-methylisocitrate lyase-like PEP mutase family enzyme